MNNSANTTSGLPIHSAFELHGQPGVTRRLFLKRTGQASVAALVADQVLRAELAPLPLPASGKEWKVKLETWKWQEPIPDDFVGPLPAETRTFYANPPDDAMPNNASGPLYAPEGQPVYYKTEIQVVIGSALTGSRYSLVRILKTHTPPFYNCTLTRIYEYGNATNRCANETQPAHQVAP